MAVKIPQYQQQTAPNLLGVTPVAREVQVSDAVGRAGMRMAGAMQGAIATYDQLQAQIAAEKKRQEEEDAKAWTASALANAVAEQATKLAEMQETTAEGAPDFTLQFNEQFDEYEQTALSLAPTETAKKYLGERLLALRTDLTQRALQFEVGERRRWRISTTQQAIDTASRAVAQDATRFDVTLAEQRAVIDAMDIPPEQRQALREYAAETMATAAVLGEAERDPELALAKIADRLGVDLEQVTGPTAAPSRDAAEVQAKYEAIGNSFGFRTTSAVRSAGENAAVGGVPDSQHLEGRGTARDWSIKGKTPAEVAAFVAALRAEGFEASVHTKGTAPHIHAELPPAKATRTIQQALAEKPEGERLGETPYDLLPVPKLVTLLGSINSKLDQQRSQYRSLIASREADDLAAYGDGKQPPQPLTAGEFIKAYGGVEGAQRWQRYQSAQQFASELAGLATKTPEEILAILKAREPQPGEGYADKAKLHGALVQAANTVLQRRAEDPIAFAIGAGLSDAEPLNLQDPDALAAGLKERVGLAETMAGKYRTRYTLLSKDEAAQMAARLQAMTAPEKAQFLQTVRGALPDPRAYQSIMAQLRPDSPVTATAGSLMAIGGEVKLGKDGLFSDAPRMSATQVAQRVLIGEDLLNPTKGDKAADGKPKFPMPPDADLRRVWAEYVGSAYAGAPDTEAASYQAFRAFYAAELASAGDYSGKFNERAAEIAAAAVTGGVADVNGSKIVLPWGVSENYVRNELRQNWQEAAAAIGIGMVPFEAVDLRTVGDGVYAVMAGTGPLRDKNGRQVFLRVRRPSRSSVPEAPTPGYQLGMAP